MNHAVCVTMIAAAVAPTKSIRHYFTEDSVRFIPSDDPEALAAVIVELASDPVERRATVERARRFYDTHNFEAQRKTYLHIIGELAHKRRPVLVAP